ncbi:MAG: hypothetical protein ACLSTO_06765 [Bilophila wadsworthia]
MNLNTATEQELSANPAGAELAKGIVEFRETWATSKHDELLEVMLRPKCSKTQAGRDREPSKARNARANADRGRPRQGVPASDGRRGRQKQQPDRFTPS